MCIICTHMDAGTLTPWEASRNRRELLGDLDEAHLKVLDKKIRRALIDYLDRLNVENNTNDVEN